MSSRYPLDQIKRAIASMEQSGDTSGDYAQLEQVVLDDLQGLGQFKDVTFEQVQKDPELYDRVVLAYWDRLGAFGIPDDLETRALFWYRPARYKQTGGDITKVKDAYERNVFQNRRKNYQKLFQVHQEQESEGTMPTAPPVNRVKPQSRTEQGDAMEQKLRHLNRLVTYLGLQPFNADELEALLAQHTVPTALPGVRTAEPDPRELERGIISATYNAMKSQPQADGVVDPNATLPAEADYRDAMFHSSVPMASAIGPMRHPGAVRGGGFSAMSALEDDQRVLQNRRQPRLIGLASGGYLPQGGMALVGEQGPELMAAGPGTTVMPIATTPHIMRDWVSPPNPISPTNPPITIRDPMVPRMPYVSPRPIGGITDFPRAIRPPIEDPMYLPRGKSGLIGKGLFGKQPGFGPIRGKLYPIPVMPIVPPRAIPSPMPILPPKPAPIPWKAGKGGWDAAKSPGQWKAGKGGWDAKKTPGKWKAWQK